jgi:hypothetical protein
VGRVALKRRVTPLERQPCLCAPLMHRVFPPSEPPDGGRPRFFRLVVVGGTQLHESWYLSAIVRLQGFSSGSPAASPRRWSPKTVTTSSMVGRSEPGCDLGPALSFKYLHHPGWGEGRAEPELYLPRGFVGHLLPQHSRERALTGLAGGSDFDNAGLVGGKHRQLQRVGLAGSAGSCSAPGAPSCRGSGCRAARIGGPPKTSRAARAAFVFWGCHAFAPVRRLCARPGRSEWGSAGGRMASVVGTEVVAAEEVLVADRITATIRAPGLQLFGFDSLSSPLKWGRGRGHYCSGIHPEAVAAVVWPSRAEVVVAAAGAGDGSHLGPCRPAGPPMWGVVRTRGGGTEVPFVMAP